MNRRQFFTLVSAAASILLCGHSPYRQWLVYRKTHLIIVTSRDDLAGDDLGEKCAAIVRTALPDSKATVGRGPRVQRIASLMSTRQAEVAVASRPNALAMYRGEGAFEQYGPIALRVVVESDTHQLVCREDFLLQHGFLLAEALMTGGTGLGLSIPALNVAESRSIPPHAGALAFAEGRALDAGEGN